MKTFWLSLMTLIQRVANQVDLDFQPRQSTQLRLRFEKALRWLKGFVSSMVDPIKPVKAEAPSQELPPVFRRERERSHPRNLLPPIQRYSTNEGELGETASSPPSSPGNTGPQKGRNVFFSGSLPFEDGRNSNKSLSTNWLASFFANRKSFDMVPNSTIGKLHHSKKSNAAATARNPFFLLKTLAFLVCMLGMQVAFAQTDIQITQVSVSDNTPNELQDITFTVKIKNNGPQATTALQILDLLPASMTFVSYTADQGTYTSGTGIWNIGALASGQTRQLDIVAHPNTGTSGATIINTASYSSSTPADNNASNNTLSVTFTVNQPDILVTKSVNDATPTEGQTILYTIVAKNNGSQNAPATGLVITDLLPTGLTYVPGSSTIPAGTTYNAGTGAWTIGTLNDNVTVTLVLAATVNTGTSGQAKTNTASVTAIDQPEEGVFASTASVNILVNKPDILVTKAVNDNTPDVGQTILYTITAKNVGTADAPATGLVITDLLPSGLTYVPGSSTIPAGTTYNAGTGAWTIGTLNDNVTVTLILAATVNAGQSGQTMTNTASVTAINQPEESTANNTASIPITVNFPDIQILKTVSNGPYNEGTNLTYTVTVKNLGPSPATGLKVKDLLPGVMTYVSSTVTQGTYTPGTGIWDIGALASGQQRVLTITAKPNSGTSGTDVTNTALLYQLDQNDTNTSNNSASVEIQVATADLLLTKSVNDNTPDVANPHLYCSSEK
ncbi:MAG: DUF11 domain-containing protein [Saprospirales bacterium]|nr:DUF11 domain-containing protein [Saprospirales bacterium]